MKTLQVQRLNLDNSWWLQWGGETILLDPWLLGSEIDGFKWFNEQWHRTPPVPVHALPAYRHVVVSQPYSDHCHAETLRQLRGAFYAVPPAVKRLKRELPETFCQIISDEGAPIRIGDLQLFRMTPNRMIDPIYHALVLQYDDEAVVYAPHGFQLTEDQLALFKNVKVRLLITSFAYFLLPFWLGGLINPGTAGALQLMVQLQPEHVVNTHDEDKRASGIVIRLAKRIYPDMFKLASQYPNIHAVQDYQLLEF